MEFEYVGKLRSLEEIRDLYGPGFRNQYPRILPEMELFFGNTHYLRANNREDSFGKCWRIDIFQFHEKWFDWIKDGNDNLIYGNEVSDVSDFVTDIENTINRMVEDL